MRGNHEWGIGPVDNKPTAADHANTGVDILAVAKKFAPEVVYLRLVELEAAEAERDHARDALRQIAALPQPALQGGRRFFDEAHTIARAALGDKPALRPRSLRPNTDET